MKLKGLTKLALSGVALAAVAATLGTSTYAWYVTNSKATVEGVQGTAKAGGLGNVLVAQASTASGKVNGHGAFAQDITLNTGNITQTSTTAGLLPTLPVTGINETTATTVTAASKITSATPWVDVDGKQMNSGSYVQFDVWVLSTDAETVNLSYTIENTTQKTLLVNQLAYAADGLPTGVNQGDTFNVNIVDALRMSITQTNYDSAYSGTELASSTILDVRGSATSNTFGSAAGTVESTDFATPNSGTANSYYKAVLGAEKPIVEAATTALSQTTTAITVVPNLETKLSFYIWLEGSDAQCFDSCSGQSFAIHLAFDTTVA